MAFNVGERVKYRYSEGPNIDPSEIHGVVSEVIPQYRVVWDDGTEELHDEDDLVEDD